MDMHAEGMGIDRQQRGELKALEGTPAHKGLHTIDIFRRDTGQLNIRAKNPDPSGPDATPPTAPYRRCSEEWRTSLRAH